MKRIFLAILVSAIFLLIGVLTLTGYGINWDTINHLPRGQAYLHYFLTGKKDYSDLSPFKNYFQDPTKLSSIRSQSRSFYQTDAADFGWFMQYDGNGHPPLSDILSSVFNRILFGKLQLINDIDAYRVYGLVLAAILVGLIFYWVSYLYGRAAGALAAVFTAFYPLFFSEMHFNTEKDVPETAYWSFFIFSFWKGITAKSVKWILLSGVFFGLALGTKFNILFVPFLVIPWLMAYLYFNFKKLRKSDLLKLAPAVAVAVLVGFSLFVGSWPYLWPDPISRVATVIGYYKGIGLTMNVDPRFIGPFGINLYPIEWIVFTTPPLLLALLIFGAGYLIYRVIKKKDSSAFLFLLWFALPIARVSFPGTTIYGGIRQIMEYVPALAIIAAAGVGFLISKIKIKALKGLLVLAISIVVIIPIWNSHPNENVYFNFLIGGLAGARKANLPSWGNSFGAAYRQGVIWINAHAPAGSTIVTAYELSPNIPKIWFRPDLNLDNRQRSGSLNAGEYAITLTYQGTENRSYYDSYLERFLDPVYEVKSDNVAILKIWKNDKQYVKVGYDKEIQLENFEIVKNQAGFRLNFDQQYKLTKIQSSFGILNCKLLTSAYAETSVDGLAWNRLPGTMPKEDWNSWRAFGEQPGKSSFIVPLAAEQARYVQLVIAPADACLAQIYNLRVTALK